MVVYRRLRIMRSAVAAVGSMGRHRLAVVADETTYVARGLPMIESIIAQVQDFFTSWIPPQLLIPQFSAAVWIVIGIVLAGGAIAYFIPMTRPLFGAISMAGILYVIGLWKGIGYQAAKQERQQKAAAKPAPPPFRFPWQF